MVDKNLYFLSNSIFQKLVIVGNEAVFYNNGVFRKYHLFTE